MARRLSRPPRYVPTGDETPDELLDMARRCGAELAPSDPRARWIDAAPELINAYHEGQEAAIDRAWAGVGAD